MTTFLVIVNTPTLFAFQVIVSPVFFEYSAAKNVRRSLGRHSPLDGVTRGRSAPVAALHQDAPAGQMTWLENPPPWLRLICFILTVNQSAALAACILRATTKKDRRLFWGKSASDDLLEDFLT